MHTCPVWFSIRQSTQVSSKQGHPTGGGPMHLLCRIGSQHLKKWWDRQARWLSMVLVNKLDNLNAIPAYMVEGENSILTIVLWTSHVIAVTCTCTCTGRETQYIYEFIYSYIYKERRKKSETPRQVRFLQKSSWGWERAICHVCIQWLCINFNMVIQLPSAIIFCLLLLDQEHKN